MSSERSATMGGQMAREMAEQPERLRALIARADELRERVLAVAPWPMHGVTIIARGSSDHAGTYGRYLLEQASGVPVSMAAPSLHTLYGAPAHYTHQAIVAVSQSGRTPEIVATVRALEAGAGRSIAVTNDPDSDLAHAARAVIDLGVGEEHAVPATKTVTAQMVAFALLARALGTAPFSDAELQAVPDYLATVLDDSEPAQEAAEALCDVSNLIVVARGFLYGAAMETALKIKETCSLLADGYSSADLRHGPIAAITQDFPVIAMSVPGPAAQDVEELVCELRNRGARLVTLGLFPDADCAPAELHVPLPEGVPETLVPILATVRGQQIARALALRLGRDPDAPAGLSKVTVT